MDAGCAASAKTPSETGSRAGHDHQHPDLGHVGEVVDRGDGLRAQRDQHPAGRQHRIRRQRTTRLIASPTARERDEFVAIE